MPLGQDYLSHSAGLPAPWGTRICTLPLVKPGTGMWRGTCWLHTGPGRLRRGFLQAKEQTFPLTAPYSPQCEGLLL